MTHPTAATRARDKQLRRAWMFAAAAVATAVAFAPDLVHAGLSSGAVMALSFFLGLGGGVAWQTWNRSDFVDRFLGWAVLFSVAMILPALPGSERASGVDVLGAWSYPGVLVGVVLAEGWMRQRTRP